MEHLIMSESFLRHLPLSEVKKTLFEVNESYQDNLYTISRDELPHNSEEWEQLMHETKEYKKYIDTLLSVIANY